MPIVERPTVPLTLDDLIPSGWREIVAPVIEKGYPYAWQPLSSAAKSAYEAGDQGKSRALWVLADAVSMMLVPKSSTSPFGASVQTSEGRSAIPSGFSAEELDVLGQVVAHVDEPWLRARLARSKNREERRSTSPTPPSNYVGGWTIPLPRKPENTSGVPLAHDQSSNRRPDPTAEKAR